MKTQIILSRTNPTTGTPFYFINIYNKDALGFIYAQSGYMIDEAQYRLLKGLNEEKYQAEGNLYVVNLA